MLLMKDGYLVRSEDFITHQIIGNPVHEVERFNQWNVDELIYLDISEDEVYYDQRNDTRVKSSLSMMEILEEVSKTCFMPLTVGGKIRNIQDIRDRLKMGADKVAMNTAAINNPELVREAAFIFGSQCIVISVDVRMNAKGRYEVYGEHGRIATGEDPIHFIRRMEQLGAGEILLHSIDRDGVAEGYDIELIQKVVNSTKLPVIALGGVGRLQHFSQGILKGGASAVAAANIFHFMELSDRNAKKTMKKDGVNVRL
ncbi:imidazole glycerol phosphate synthase subunit HisF [Paenibacillus alginolyticus]|uniref:imidazole glycerol phosphate synthase subunit HisF n=1 Tax=Paenibacillus alginolyticus TaxID=59839 RepID=UPI002DBEF208|nr:imidazole glycerol phosphate synthase cyclase subunit [Paenibacillus alginolyticus]MEC0143666.1 imidazole glycerol phosphate synthase cyclase subunit [Paenibacillus alginolyticus]